MRVAEICGEVWGKGDYVKCRRNSSTSTRFYYAGQQMIAEVANPSGAILRRYVPGPGVDEPVVWYEGAGTADRRWLHADERGSVIAVRTDRDYGGLR